MASGKPELIQKVREMQAIAEVTKLLGEPHSEAPLYEPKIKSPKRIGSTYTFLVRDSGGGHFRLQVRADLEGRILLVSSDEEE